MIELIGFLLLVLAIAGGALVAAVAVSSFLKGYRTPQPENERFGTWRLFDRQTRRFNKAYDARRDALLEAEARRRADREPLN